VSRPGGRQIALRAYGVGILAVAVFGSDFFWLGAYGHGGGPEYRGTAAIADGGFRPNVNYVLVNHGELTVVSPHYWHLVRRAERVDLIVDLAALPFLLAALLAYWKQAERAEGRYGPMLRLWVLLFLPRPGEPAITTFAKTYWFMSFAGIVLFQFTSISECAEAEFLRRVFIAHVVGALAAALATCGMLLLRRAARPRADAQAAGVRGTG